MVYRKPVDVSVPRFCEFYDELPLWSAPFGLQLLEQVPIRPGLSYLDVGAGTGFLTVELAQRCGAGSRVIAVDPWPGAMERLRAKLEYLGLDNVTCIERDAANTGLDEASVDVLVSNLGVNNFDNVDAVLHELYRVAKPGAAFVLSTNLTGHMAEFYEVLQGVLGETGQDAARERLDDEVRRRGTVESVGGLLQNAGFEVRRAVTGSFRMRFADGSALLRHHFIRLGFLQGWIAIVDADAVAPTFERLERRLNEVAEQHGELALTVPHVCIQAQREN